NPGKVSLASFGTATVSHLAVELLKAMAGINLLHVPYRCTAPMLSDLLGGQVQASFDNLAGSIEFIKLGKLRPLAITSTTRSDKLPEVPACMSSCRALRQAPGVVSAHLRTHLRTSSESSTERLTRRSAILRLSHV